jgi:hypothetical protein
MEEFKELASDASPEEERHRYSGTWRAACRRCAGRLGVDGIRN